MNAKIQKLDKEIQKLEDKLSEKVAELWKLVDPTPDEVEEVSDVFAQREDNWNPTDLEVLRRVLDGREDES